MSSGGGSALCVPGLVEDALQAYYYTTLSCHGLYVRMKLIRLFLQHHGTPVHEANNVC
jgi:hypothetical protein